jgi:fermentation-respiration switch protein FrsA (DUF1100 family)
MKNIRFILIMLSLLTLTACESLINSLSFFPDTDYTVSSEKLPLYIKPLMLVTKDGIKLEALYLHHEKGSRKIVIYFHGNAGNLYHRIDEASVIYNMGHNVIISGYRGYGRSSGEPTEDGIYIDGRTVLKYVSGTLHYKPENIYIYGRSIGSTVAVDISQNIPLGGVILITPLSSAEDFIREKYASILAGAGRNHYQSIRKIRDLKSPLLVIHGTDDDIIPYTLGVKLYEASPGRKSFTGIPGGGHNNLEFINPQLYWNSVKSFIDEK